MHLKHLPSCVFICARKLQASANFLLHNSQECGLSPTKNESKTYNQQTKYIIYGQWKRCVIYRFVLAKLLIWMNMQHVKDIAAYNSIFGFIFVIFFSQKLICKLTGVQKKMVFEIGVFRETSWAYVTLERPRTAVHVHVWFQISRCWEGFRTKATFMWFFLYGFNGNRWNKIQKLASLFFYFRSHSLRADIYILR